MTCFENRSEACELIWASRLPGMMSAQSNTSVELLSTDSAPAVTLELIFTSISFALPLGIVGIPCEANFGFLTNVKDTFGTTLLYMYGPSPGGGLDDRFFIAVPLGTIPSDGTASTFSNAP